jgi:hypothetical protein
MKYLIKNQKFKTMANISSNTLSIKGSYEEVDEVLSFIASVDEEGGSTPFDFNKVIPMPDDIDKGPGDCETNLSNPKYWTNWCTANWGTKWNACDAELKAHGLITFNTAWAPPIPVIRELSKRFPKVVFSIEYWTENDVTRYDVEDYQDGYLTQEITKWDVDLIKELEKENAL